MLQPLVHVSTTTNGCTKPDYKGMYVLNGQGVYNAVLTNISSYSFHLPPRTLDAVDGQGWQSEVSLDILGKAR